MVMFYISNAKFCFLEISLWLSHKTTSNLRSLYATKLTICNEIKLHLLFFKFMTYIFILYASRVGCLYCLNNIWSPYNPQIATLILRVICAWCYTLLELAPPPPAVSNVILHCASILQWNAIFITQFARTYFIRARWHNIVDP